MSPLSRLWRLLRPRRVERPVFLTGCGRSGTTILGTTLSQHPAITYLNERRDLWTAAYPETDVWSPGAPGRGGSLVLTRSDCTPTGSARLHALFGREIGGTGRPRLVEKLPINNFRLDFLLGVFPDALFLHILRNGLEVARSIERECAEGGWYGADDYKWLQLVRHARSRPDTAHLPALCRTNLERGLLEWRLSVEAAASFLSSLPREAYLEVTYEELVARPVRVIEGIEHFVGIPPDDRVHAFATANIGRRSAEAARLPVPDNALPIAGALLLRFGHAPAAATAPAPAAP